MRQSALLRERSPSELQCAGRGMLYLRCRHKKGGSTLYYSLLIEGLVVDIPVGIHVRFLTVLSMLMVCSLCSKHYKVGIERDAVLWDFFFAPSALPPHR